jgi:hypothetical protein
MIIFSIMSGRRREEISPSSAHLLCKPFGWRLWQLNKNLYIVQNKFKEGTQFHRGKAVVSGGKS